MDKQKKVRAFISPDFFCLSELFCFLFQCLFDVNGIERYRTSAQFWDVETLQTVVVKARLLLWEYKWLVGLALPVDITEVRFAVDAIIPFTDEDKPFTGMRPAVIGIALLAVYDAEAVYLSGLQVEHTEVCLWMPDREGAIVGNGEEAVSSVGTYLRMAYRALRIERIYLRTECSRPVFEWDADKSIFQTLQILCLQIFPVGYAIVDVSAVGREGREGLEFCAVAGERR